MNMAINIAHSAPDAYKKCIIYADSQPAIIATTKPSKQSGQAIIAEVLDNLDSLQACRPNLQVEIVWIPGHMDIEGNEMADQAAKKAATPTETHMPFKHKALKSARSTSIKDASKQEWERLWKNGKQNSKQLRRITAKQHTAKGLKLYNGITSRSRISQIARLRTGHCSLNQYLHRFNIEESPLCECGSGSIENVEHYLLICSRYDRQRAQLINKAGIGSMWIEKLLGYPKLIKHTLEYVENTKRMKF
jgi:hypothetical protein